MKKIYFLLLLMLLPLLASAQTYYDVEVNGIYYKLNNETKEATVVANTGLDNDDDWSILNPSYSGDLVIPETFVSGGNTYTVTKIDGQVRTSSTFYSRGAFEGCKELTSITIPKSVKSVGNYAFSGCTSLNAVYISDMTAWCNITFDLYDSREGDYFPRANPLYYAHSLYLNGSLISDLIIPDDITKIGAGTFIGSNIKSVTIPKTVNTIDSYAFDGCDNLNDVYIYSKSIALNIDKNSFKDVGNLTLHIRERYKTNFIYDDCDWVKFGKVEFIEGVDFHLIYKVDDEEYKNIWYEVGESITPEAEPTKEGYSFSGWSEIPETMPDHDVTVTGTFSPNTYKLTYLVDGEEYKVVDVKCDDEITPEPEPTRKGMTFSGWSEIPATMPGKDVEVKGTFSWSQANLDNVIYEVIDTINNKAAVCKDGGASGELIIPSKVEIDGYTYAVTDMYHSLFTNNMEITSVVLPESMMKIGNEVFKGCKNIQAIEIKAGTQIGTRAFANIDKLTSVTCSGEMMPDVDRTAFENSYIEDYVTLYVPAAVLNKYKETVPWKNFKEIMAISETAGTYKLTYMVDGEEYKTYQIAEGSAITPEAAPTKDGYVFSGWSTIPATMPAEDVTITGTFLLATDFDEITIKEIGKTTWCSEYDLDFTNVEGVKAYTATGYNNITKTIWLTRVMEVPAGTGILVKGDAGNYRIPHATVQSAYANWFVGNLGETIKIGETDGDKTNYYLKDGTFKSVAGYANIGKNKAYLQLPTSVFGGTRSIGISYDDEDGTTSIKDLTPALSEGEGEWFTLQGQRVAKPGKGLYIKNGKKVIVR